ncbi:hypothetical protein QBC39DRAFT_382747 [Podospora conica]|nr:hypothetical protein QBC39DRAFT_382747 [Schizothecium conicum]
MSPTVPPSESHPVAPLPAATTPNQTDPNTPEQPADPAPEWVRPPDFDARVARVRASVPYDPESFRTLSRADQIAFYEAMMDGMRKEFPDMPTPKNTDKWAGDGDGKSWVEVTVDFSRVLRTLDDETTAKLNAITARMYESLFDEGVVEEVRGEVRGLLGERYPGVLGEVEGVLFSRREGLEKMREYARKEVEEGRGNPFGRGCKGGVCGVPVTAGADGEGEGEGGLKGE